MERSKQKVCADGETEYGSQYAREITGILQRIEE
jgi:hypothetical protein